MAATIGGILVDPDSLGYELKANTSTTTKEIALDTANLVIKLTRVGNLTADGVTLQCLYSKLKEIWLTDSALNYLPFPFSPITNEQYQMINGWNFDQALNPTTKITVPGYTFTSNALIFTSSNFNSANVYVGAYVTGTGVNASAKITSINSDTSITVSNIGTAIGSTTLTVYGDVDYSYNLIRNGGWALMPVKDSTSQEEWAGILSLGALGAEGLTFTTTLASPVTYSPNITINDATTIQVGSYVYAANVPLGTKVSSVISTTQITLTKSVGPIASGAVVTIKPFDQPYYQIGNTILAAPTNSILPGQINQPVKIYGDTTHGNFDYRGSANVFNVYTREQGYTYSQASKLDIGFANLTYQAYRFPLVSSTDTYITASDATISSNGTTPTGSPYNNMAIKWYSTPQVRYINGVPYNFTVIIDANTALSSSTTYGTATAQQVYEYVQWALRRNQQNINQGNAQVKYGGTTRALLQYQGSTLNTLYDPSDGGVYIDHFREIDINNLAFADNLKAVRTFKYIAFGQITFNSFLSNDGANASYKVFFNQINQGNVIYAGNYINGSLKFGTRYAQLVQGYATDLNGDGSYQIKGNLSGNISSVTFDFPYDNCTQAQWLPNNTYYAGDEYAYITSASTTWYRVKSSVTTYVSGATWTTILDGTNANVILGPTVVLTTVGTANADYFTTTGTILKSTTNLLAATPDQELNYGT